MSEKVIVDDEIKVFDLQELNDKIINKYKNEPLQVIVPYGFTGGMSGTYSPVDDQLSLGMETFAPTLEDAELLVSGLIGCIPGYGPVLQGVFSKFTSLFKESLSAEDVKKMVDEKLGKLKEEILVMIDDKVEKGEIDNYKKLCDKSFVGLTESSLELLMDDLNILKKKLEKKKQPKKPFMDGLRLKFDLLRINIKSLLPLFQEKKYLKYIYQQYLELTFIYILCMQNLMNFWYQFGFDACYARGTPAMPEYNIKETHSYREKLHINIQRILKSLQEGLVTNQKGLENAYRILECDPIVYPVALIKSKESSKGIGQIEINSQQKSTPFIYRIDALNCKQSPSSNEKSYPKESDSITGCKGILLNVVQAVSVTKSTSTSTNEPVPTTTQLSIKLSEEKFVRVRLYVAIDSSSSVDLKMDQSNSIPAIQWKKLKDEYGSLQESDCQNSNLCTYSSGFVQSQKSSSKESQIDISIHDQSQNNTNNKLLFVEIIISDN